MSAPELPATISPNGKEVWDWAAKFSEHVHRQDKIHKLKAEIAAPLRCGDCYWWMKSRDCPREVNVNGRYRGPSAGDTPCAKMQETKQSIDLRDERRAALRKLEDVEHG